MSVSDQSNLVLSDLRGDPYTIQSHPREKTFSGRAYEFFRIVLGSIDKGRNWANGHSSNSLGKDRLCCVIEEITRWDAFFFFFFFIINNKTRRIIDILDYNKELEE